MAFIKLIITGKGGTPLSLPVKVISGLPLVMDGLERETIAIEITNPLSNKLVINNLTVKVEGEAAPKIRATLRFDTHTIPAGKTVDNFIDVESVELLYEGESFSITLEWSNG